MYKDKIDVFFEKFRPEFIEAIKKLVVIPSVKAAPVGEAPFGIEVNNALKKALEISESYGFKTKNYNNYVGTVDLSSDPTALDILGHLDVVPANPEEWTVCHPYQPVEKDGKLYGRGTADDKGPSIAALFAMLAVKEIGVPLKSNVRLILGTDEETGGSDIDYYYSIEKPAPATFSPDADFPVINVEKGRLTAELVASFEISGDAPKIVSITSGKTANVIPDAAHIVIEGISADEVQPIIDRWEEETKQTAKVTQQENRVLIETKSKAGHAAYPDQANNSVTGALDLVKRLPLANSEGFEKLKSLSELFPHNDWAGKAIGVAMEDEISEALTICLNVLNYNETNFNAIFDSRTPICSNKANTADVLIKNSNSVGIDVNVIKQVEPHHVPADSDFIKTLLSAYEDYTGNEGYCTVTGGGTYVHGLKNAVAFGPTMPGVDTNIHGADEHTIIDDLILSAKFFTKVIIDMCS